MRENKFSFFIIMRLKETGFNRWVKEKLATPETDKKVNQRSLDFYKENESRVNEVLSLLADDKSRKVWKTAVKSRIYGEEMPGDLWSDTDQYFVKGIVSFRKGEVFVDGGAFIGDTISHLFHYAGVSNIKKVIVFEPDPMNLRKLKRYFGANDKVTIIERGLGEKEGCACFSENGSGSAIVETAAAENVIKIPVVSIDGTPECEEATFIKMDIEGAEMAALAGAENVIKKNKPKLAICIYHSDEDMLRIIEYIHELVPEYKLYVRHHTQWSGETVLYAVL